jgi:hypothetical protein
MGILNLFGDQKLIKLDCVSWSLAVVGMVIGGLPFE